jgi:hypothetical protein
MKLIIVLVTTCLLCSSCGVKDKPEYQSQNSYNIKINII